MHPYIYLIYTTHLMPTILMPCVLICLPYRLRGEEKIELARKISVLTLELEHCTKERDDAQTRANTAEERNQALQGEVAEARSIQQLNAQLHKDLSREQQHRKRLHNEIEDMKGTYTILIRLALLSTY